MFFTSVAMLRATRDVMLFYRSVAGRFAPEWQALKRLLEAAAPYLAFVLSIVLSLVMAAYGGTDVPHDSHWADDLVGDEWMPPRR